MTDKKRSDSIPITPNLDTSVIIDDAEQKKGIVDKRVLFLSIQAMVNAVIIGVIAKLLVYLINLITNLSFYGRFSFEHAGPAENTLGLFVIVVPIIGSIIVGIMAKYGSAAIRGHGIPEAMEQVLVNESRINPVITLLKPVSSAIAIGTGGPFGAGRGNGAERDQEQGQQADDGQQKVDGAVLQDLTFT